LFGVGTADATTEGRMHMNSTNDSNARKGLREWWLSPPRSGMQRLLSPWEYRRVRGFGIVHIVGGVLAGIAGSICLGYAVYGWAAFFLAIGLGNLAGGYWELTIARSQALRARGAAG
jgi:hypothetical protein